MVQGFNLYHEQWGRGWGHGVYLSRTALFARTWGKVVVKCRLQPGTRILWHDRFDSQVIASLRKEFNQGITRPDFWKHIPDNKQLTKKEMVNLWRYLTDRYYRIPEGLEKAPI